MADVPQDMVRALATQLGIPGERCRRALEEAGGDAGAAFRALLQSGEVDPATLDRERLPGWAFTEAQLARTRRMMAEMQIPDQLQDFFQAALGQVGADEWARSGPAGTSREQAGAGGGPVRRIRDPEFGTLEWDEGGGGWGPSWWGRCRLVGFDWEVALQLEGRDAAPPVDAQRRAYRHLEACEGWLRPVVEAALSGFYRGLRAADPSALPALHATSSIWGALDPPVCEIPLAQDAGRTVALGFQGEWDRGHRYRVWIREAALLDVERVPAGEPG